MNTITTTILTLFIFGFIIFIDVMTPKLTRKDLYFSIRVPADKISSQNLVQIYQHYKKGILTFTLPLAIAISLFVNIEKNPILLLGAIFLILGLHLNFYLKARRDVLVIKAQENWTLSRTQITIIDTSHNRKTDLVSPYWFLIGLGLVIINLVYVTTNYNQFPSEIPYHWNAAGIADSLVAKTPTTMLLFPSTQLFIILIMFFAYKSIALTKQQIDVDDPEQSRIRVGIFKRRWSITLVLMMFILQFLFMTFTLVSASVFVISPLLFQVITYGSVGAILLIVVYVTLTTGQGGSQLNLDRQSNASEMNRDDDDQWKLGMFYVNKNDPSIFIEKRFGIGFTINFGNPLAIGLFIGLLVVILLFAFLPSIL